MQGLTVDNVSCQRAGLRVLEGVSLRVAPGQALVLRGPNGIGKTTLLRTLAGLQPPASGTVAAEEGSLVYASHADGVKTQLSVYENLVFWSKIYAQPERVEQALEQFNLTGLANRRAANLSAGQKRRLGLARLAVTGCKGFLLDEPTVSLDTDATGLFAQFIADHLDDGGFAVMATHIDLGIVADTLDLSPFKPTFSVPDANGFDEAFL